MQPLELDRVLVLNPSIRAERVDEESLFLISERQRLVVADSRVVKIASLLDGKRTVMNVLRDAGSQVPEAQTLYILGHLASKGYIVEAAPELSPERGAFWHGLGIDARAVIETFGNEQVRIRTVGSAELGQWMADALRQAGLCLGDGAHVQVVVTDDYLNPELAGVNVEARRTKTPWFLVQPVGTRPLIGPFFRPGEGPCWECLAFWLRNNRPVEELVRRQKGVVQMTPPLGALEASARAACNLGALECARAMVSTQDFTSVLHSRLMALDLTSFEMSSHSVLRRPQCPACGDPGRTAALAEKPIRLAATPRLHCSDGGYRTSSPEETWRRYAHLVSPICGPVSYVVPTSEESSQLRVVYASGYLTSPRSGVPRKNTFDKMCSGKGRSRAQAKTSALCEALERFSGVWQGDEARVRATLDELGALAVPPPALTNFSEAQRRAAGATEDRRHRIPRHLGRDVAIDWSPGWSLSYQERRFIPLSYCYSEAPAETGAAYSEPCGNGAAAGTCLEEAILQGVLELIERDAVGIWWYNRVARPGVALASFGEPYFTALYDEYSSLGWTLWALDLTHDLKVPTFAALAHQGEEDRFAIGFGCHLDARLALQRALTEVNQLFDPAARRRAPWDLDRMPDRAYLQPDPRCSPVEASDFQPAAGSDLRADVLSCVERLRAANLELIVVNKTRPDIDLSVVQTVVPGLRHFWPRFGPGRLYEVPCALGWLRAPLKEEDLNPVPLLV